MARNPVTPLRSGFRLLDGAPAGQEAKYTNQHRRDPAALRGWPMADGLAPPNAPTLVVALDLVHDAARRASHRPGPGADHGSDWSAHHRAGGGTDRRAGALLPGGAGPGQET